jgi:holo-[acyl-carrier protein] synthase
MKAIGIDLVEIKRIQRAQSRFGQTFLQRLFTQAELSLGSRHSGRRQAEFWAGRFAAKEAVAKALGTGFGSALGWRDIEIGASGLGAPQVRLLGAAGTLARQRGISGVLVSLTHSREYAMAIAVALGEKEDVEISGS